MHIELDWLWQSLFARLVWTALALLCSFAIARLKKQNSTWVQPIFYGLAGFLLVCGVVVGLRFLLTPPPATAELITPENFQAHLRDWLLGFRLPIQQKQDQNSYFMYEVGMLSGNHVLVTRTRDNDRYLTFAGRVGLSAEHLGLLRRLSQRQYADATGQIYLELVRARITFVGNVDQKSRAIEQISISRSLPITNLTEDVFGHYLDDIDGDMNITWQAVNITLNRLTP
jgi:hypothetical protein